MCKVDNYIRFKSIAEKIDRSQTFHTELGDRVVECFLSPNKDTVSFIYYDKDSSILFYLSINHEGKITKKFSLIDDSAIFSAVYEVECILYNIQKEHKDGILEKLFETTFSQMLSAYCKYSFTQYR